MENGLLYANHLPNTTQPMLHNHYKVLLFSLLCLMYIAYSGYIYSGEPEAPLPPDALADRGKKIWQENNCIACHQIYQLGGYLGPDLTNAYSLKGPGYIKAFLENGTEIMPDFNLSPDEITALTAYLAQIDATGSADPRSFTISNSGMTHQK